MIRDHNLPSFDKPSVVICGTKDILTPPEDSQEMASLLPQADLFLLDEIAHMSTLEAPDDVNNALRRGMPAPKISLFRRLM